MDILGEPPGGCVELGWRELGATHEFSAGHGEWCKHREGLVPETVGLMTWMGTVTGYVHWYGRSQRGRDREAQVPGQLERDGDFHQDQRGGRVKTESQFTRKTGRLLPPLILQEVSYDYNGNDQQKSAEYFTTSNFFGLSII